MDKEQAINLAKRYKEMVAEKLPLKALYLYGSYSKGNYRADSDIDIAVIVERLDDDYFKDTPLLWKLRRKISNLIEPVLLTEDMDNPLYCKRLLNYILCIRFFIEVHSIVSASRFFHMPTYLRVVIECQSRFFPFFPAFSRNCPDYFLHTSGSSSFRSLSDLGAR